MSANYVNEQAGTNHGFPRIGVVHGSVGSQSSRCWSSPQSGYVLRRKEHDTNFCSTTVVMCGDLAFKALSRNIHSSSAPNTTPSQISENRELKYYKVAGSSGKSSPLKANLKEEELSQAHHFDCWLWSRWSCGCHDVGTHQALLFVQISFCLVQICGEQ